MTEPSTDAGRRLAQRLRSVSVRSGVEYRSWVATILAIEREAGNTDALRAALTDEDEIAHGEAWDDVQKRGIGVCAYCDDEWPCRTQRGIDRLLAALAASDAGPAGGTDALRAALERGYLIADDLDSNHARWVIQKLADEAGITFNLPPVNEPNNRLREQLSEARAALAASDAGPAGIAVERLTKALITSSLMPRYMEYARLSPSMSLSETVERTAERWAATLAAEYDRLSRESDR
jgi:hypothetical protein